MMNSRSLGQMVIEGVPFFSDPRDDGKFIMTEAARHTFLGNIMKANIQSMKDYSDLIDKNPGSDVVRAFKQILTISSDGFKWAFNFIKENYPGAFVIEDENRTEFDFLLVYITEAVYGGYTASECVKAELNYDISNKIIQAVMKSNDYDLKNRLMAHIELAKKSADEIKTKKELIDEIMTQFCLDSLLPRTVASMLYTINHADSIDFVKEQKDKAIEILISALKCSWSSVNDALSAFAGISKVIGFMNYCINIDTVPDESMTMEFFKDSDKYLDYFDSKDLEERM